MPIISVHVPQELIHRMDELVARGYFSNRSEVIRVAIAEFLKKWDHRDKERPEIDIGYL